METKTRNFVVVGRGALYFAVSQLMQVFDHYLKSWIGWTDQDNIECNPPIIFDNSTRIRPVTADL